MRDFAPTGTIVLSSGLEKREPVGLASKFLSGWVSTLVSGVVMFLSYRMFLRTLGYEQYGLWLLLSTVLNVVQLGSVGLGPAITRLVAQTHTSGEHGAVIRYLLMSVFLVTAVGLAVTGVVLSARGVLVSLFHLNPSASVPFLLLLPYMTVISVYAVIVDLFLATLSGLGRIDLANYSQLLSQIAGTLVSVFLVRADFGLKGLVFGTAISLVLLHSLVGLQLSRITPLRLPKSADWDRRDLSKLLGFGGWVAGATIMNALIGPTTRILLARYNGVASIPAYDLALGACYKLRSVWESALRALLPEVSRLSAGGRAAGVRDLRAIYSKASRILLAGATPMYAFVFVLAAPLLRIWLGAHGDSGTLTLRILLVGTFVNLLAVPPYYLLMGMGQVRYCFIGSGVMAIVSLSVAALAIHFLATLSVPMASVSFVLGTTLLTVYLLWKARRALAGPPSAYA